MPRFTTVIAILLAAFSYDCATRAADAPTTTCKRCDTSADFDQRCPLVVTPCERATISDSDKVLDALFASRQPVVLYVHGRGREPRKSAQDNILGALEKQYGVKVVMFNWDAHAFLFSRPVDRAHASAPALRDLIGRLGKYRELHPDTATVPVSLLVHSMGSIVLKPALEGLSLTNANGPIFDNILITESDEDAQGHSLWVEQLKSRRTILLTFNKNDSTLGHSNHGPGKTPLGKGPVSPLANNAFYLDTTNLVGKAHRLFDKGRQHSIVAVCQIFTSMLRGGNTDLGVGHTIQTVQEERILLPMGKANKTDACFQGVKDSPDEDDD